MEEAKRRFLRVSTRLKAYLKKVQSKDTKPVHHYSRSYQHPTFDLNLKKFGLPEALKEYLDIINSKLDMILSIQSLNFIERDYPFSTEVIEIGGGGLKCLKPSKLDVKVGDFLDFVIILSTFPLWMVGVIGEIKRIEKIKGQEVMAVEFSQIRESDKEEIIRFVFQEERENIRKQKDME